MHCDLWHCFDLSLSPPPASSLLFSQKYTQNYRAFKIRKFIRKLEGIDQKEQSNFSIVLSSKLTGLASVEFVVVSTGFGQKREK
jgi:hypothetical protein